jgi:phosphate-transporting ATPase
VPSVLTIRGLTRPGLEPIDLDLASGECVVVRGPSGAGKSLFLRAIADLDPNDGHIALDGDAREAMPAPDWRRQVTYVAAEAAWWADDVGDHFADWTAAEAFVEAMLLPADCRGWPVARLSTGEKQRLGLARALALSPRVLLLDEPTSGLDAAAQEAVEDVMKDRLDGGAGIIVVTHDPAQARHFATRCLDFEDGRASEMAL